MCVRKSLCGKEDVIDLCVCECGREGGREIEKENLSECVCVFMIVCVGEKDCV